MSRREFNDSVVAEFRANGGRVGGDLAGVSVLLLHGVGARSGVVRVTPLGYKDLGGGRYLIVGSNGGSPRHPSWCHNLRANPDVDVEVGTERLTVRAVELRGAARAGKWAMFAAEVPALVEFQARTARQIPLFELTRDDAGPTGTREGQA